MDIGDRRTEPTCAISVRFEAAMTTKASNIARPNNVGASPSVISVTGGATRYIIRLGRRMMNWRVMALDASLIE